MEAKTKKENRIEDRPENGRNDRVDGRLIIIAGPTAVGKTKTAVELARLLDSEVVSADSMQIYRGMDIGTAKVTKEEMQGVPHHLIDVMDPRENYNVIRFCEMAAAAIGEIHSRGKIPVLCGGTGFYIQALLYGIDFPEEPEDAGLRRELHRLAEEKGPEAVWQQLKQADPEYAQMVPPENIVKCIRALEFYRYHGEKLSEHNRRELAGRTPRYDARLFVLYDEREALFERVSRRVDRMMEQGLLQETERLLASGIDRTGTAMQAIGYRQLAEYLDGSVSLEQAVENIKTATRRYAKRQLVWFRREPDAVWVHVGKEDPVERIRRELEKPDAGKII